MSETAGDAAFAEMALRLKLLTQEQIDECRQAQEQLQKMSMSSSMEEVAQKKAFLDAAQVRQVLKALGVPGSQIPGFTILGRIARGGMGIIYRARQRSVDRIVAIKVLSSLLTSDKAFVGRFLNEAIAVAKLSHPNIISVYDAGQHEGMYYMVMEYVEGRNLGEIVAESGPLPEPRVRQLTLQVAEALAYIERQGLVHRDIKPENLMLDRDNTIKVADFGLAKLPARTDKTDTDLVMGTPLYIAPEQAKGKAKLDIRTDLYALGGTLYFLLTGKPPYSANSAFAIVLKHMNDPVPDPRKLRPQISEPMARIVKQLLQKDPADRIQNSQELIAAIKGQTMRRPTAVKKSNAPLISSAIGAAALILLLVLALGPGRTRRPTVRPDDAAPTAVKPAPPKPADPSPAASQTQALAEEALGYYKAKEWAKAARILKDIPEFQSKYRQCIEELDTARLLEEIREAEAQRRWKEIVEVLSPKFQELRTGTADEHRQRVEILAARAQTEIEAEFQLGLVLKEGRQKNWDEYEEERRRLEAYKSTKSYAEAKAVLAELDRQFEASGSARAEQRAVELWSRAQEAFREKRFAEAKGILEEFKRFADTAPGKTHETEAARMLRECSVHLAEELDAQAREAWSRALKARDDKDWSAALEALDKLESLRDSRTYAANKKAADDLRKFCLRQAGAAARIIDDFEAGVGRWEAVAKGEKPKFSESNESKLGKKAMRVSFARTAAPDDWALVLKGGLKLPADTVSLRFWARATQPVLGLAMSFSLVVVEEEPSTGSRGTFAAPLKLESQWREFDVPLSGLRPVLAEGGFSDREAKATKVRAVGVGCFGAQGALGVLVDKFRVIVRE